MTQRGLVAALALALAGCSCSAGQAPGAAVEAGCLVPAGCGAGGSTDAGPSGTSSAPVPSSTAPSGPSLPATSSALGDPALQLGHDRQHPPDPDLDWTGWKLHPALPKGCRGMYVPDDVKKREKALSWQPCPASMGISCQELVRDWDSDIRAFPGTGDVLVGGNERPEVLGIAYVHNKSKVLEEVLYHGSGQPVAALREDSWHDNPAANFVPGVSRDGKYLDLQMSEQDCGVYAPQSVLVVPADQPSQLMYSSQPTLSWSNAVVAHQDVQAVFTSGQLATAMLVGAAAAGDLATGKSAMITPSGGSADWDPYIVEGGTTFLARGVQGEVSIWVSSDMAMATPFIQPPGDAVSFTTDGKTMVWSVSSDPTDPINGVYAREDVYAAPYTTDPTKLQATRKWMGRLPTPWACLGMKNGYAYGSDCAGTRRAFVLRVSDNKWWEVQPPQGWLPPRSIFFASPTELWMVSGDPSGSTILRVPYSQLTPRDFTQGGPPP